MVRPPRRQCPRQLALLGLLVRAIAFWGLLPALAAALLGLELAPVLGWWALAAAYVLLGLIQAAMVTWTFFWHGREDAANVAG